MKTLTSSIKFKEALRKRRDSEISERILTKIKSTPSMKENLSRVDRGFSKTILFDSEQMKEKRVTDSYRNFKEAKDFIVNYSSVSKESLKDISKEELYEGLRKDLLEGVIKGQKNRREALRLLENSSDSCRNCEGEGCYKAGELAGYLVDEYGMSKTEAMKMLFGKRISNETVFCKDCANEYMKKALESSGYVD